MNFNLVGKIGKLKKNSLYWFQKINVASLLANIKHATCYLSILLKTRLNIQIKVFSSIHILYSGLSRCQGAFLFNNSYYDSAGDSLLT